MSLAAFVGMAGVIGTPSAFPVGSYKADLSQAPKSSRGVLQAYFGQSYLVFLSDGRFELCGIEQRGYWRREGNRFVLVYDGFFFARSHEPADALRKAWPESHAEGMILSQGSGGTLVLKDWGAAKGPIVFRPRTKLTVAELLVTSNKDEETPAESTEAYWLLKERQEGEWPSFIRFIGDPKRPWQERSWAALVLGGLKNPKGVEAAAELIVRLTPTKEEGRERTIARSLAGVVERHPTSKTADILIEAQRKGLIQPSVTAKVLKVLKRKSDIPLLMDWLKSELEYDKIDSLEALAVLDAREALSEARRLTMDEKEGVQVRAYGLIARLSPDRAERGEAILKLAKWLDSADFLTPFAAVEALCQTNHPDALPYLVAILGSNRRAIYRRNTAIALGDLGDPRAVQALIEAKTRVGVSEDWQMESEVRRAAAEALVKIGKVKRAEGYSGAGDSVSL